MNEPISKTETKHNEFLELLKPLIKFMVENEFNYFMVAGKDGLCSRYLKGDLDEVSGMISELIEKNKQVRGLLEYCVNETTK